MTTFSLTNPAAFYEGAKNALAIGYEPINAVLRILSSEHASMDEGIEGLSEKYGVSADKLSTAATTVAAALAFGDESSLRKAMRPIAGADEEASQFVNQFVEMVEKLRRHYPQVGQDYARHSIGIQLLVGIGPRLNRVVVTMAYMAPPQTPESGEVFVKVDLSTTDRFLGDSSLSFFVNHQQLTQLIEQLATAHSAMSRTGLSADQK